MMRAGDVIPQVVSPVTQRRTGKEKRYRPPKKCPACGTPTVKPEGEVWTRCPNRLRLSRPDRPGAQALRLTRGDGHRGIRREARAALLRGGPRARAAARSTTSRSSGWSRSKASSASRRRTWSPRSSASKRQPFHRVLYALGIPGIGGVNARTLAAHFGSIDAADGGRRRGDRGGRGHRPGAGRPDRETFDEPRNQRADRRPARAGLQLDRRARRPRMRPAARWQGKTFVLTGTLRGHVARARRPSASSRWAAR